MAERKKETPKRPPRKRDDFILQVRHLKMYFPTQTGFFKTRDLKAVDDVSFEVKRGETLGIVGESGCGKTTLGRTILHLYEPTDGEIIFNGHEIRSKRITKPPLAKLKSKTIKKSQMPSESERSGRQKRSKPNAPLFEADYEKAVGQEKEKRKNYKKDLEYLHLHAQMVFQDPYSSLDPRMTVEDIIAEPLDAHKSLFKRMRPKGSQLQSRFRHQRVFRAHDHGRPFFEQATRYPHEFSGGQRQRIGIARSPCPQSGVGRLR
jgi:oligopeptide transport system ATP-binding protein